MPTFLFDEIIFGPVKSRRLGISLGINLLPTDIKVCSFDCIYCECGWTPQKYIKKVVLPTRREVKQKLEVKLKDMGQMGKLPNVITFAGNGEPTMHPDFNGIIEDTIELRNLISSDTKIAVLSNATMLHKKAVFEALLKIEDNIQKLDSAFPETISFLDRPNKKFEISRIIEQLSAFKGKVKIQTMFVRGMFKGNYIDNTSDREVEAWLELLYKINPLQVMIYTIDRDTPVDTLQKIPVSELYSIAGKVKLIGLDVQVSG